MKTLYILRHAKSSWEYPQLSDFERPLNKRGNKAAPLIGSVMAEKGYIPEFVLSSPAERAKQTSGLIREAAGIETDVVFENAIYDASTNALFNLVSTFDDSYNSAMVVGHNPGFEGLVQILSGRYERMPTAALAVVNLDIDSWSELTPAAGEIAEVLRPKELKRKSRKS